MRRFLNWMRGSSRASRPTHRPSAVRLRLEAMETRSLPSITGVAGFYTPDDGFRHAIVGTTDGVVHEVYYTITVESGAPVRLEP